MTATVLIAHPSKEPTIISRFIKFIAVDKIAAIIDPPKLRCVSYDARVCSNTHYCDTPGPFMPLNQ
jgi:hypothetical protein